MTFPIYNPGALRSRSISMKHRFNSNYAPFAKAAGMYLQDSIIQDKAYLAAPLRKLVDVALGWEQYDRMDKKSDRKQKNQSHN